MLLVPLWCATVVGAASANCVYGVDRGGQVCPRRAGIEVLAGKRGKGGVGVQGDIGGGPSSPSVFSMIFHRQFFIWMNPPSKLDFS